MSTEGYQSIGINIDTAEITSLEPLDMGHLALEAALPDLRLSVLPGQSIGKSYLHFSSAIAVDPFYLDSSVHHGQGGLILCDLFLNEDEDGDVLQKCLGLTACTSLVVQELNGELVPVERIGEEWRTQAVKRVLMELDFRKNQSPTASYSIHLEWRGVRVLLGRGIPGQKSLWAFDMPTNGTSLYVESQDKEGTTIGSSSYRVQDGDSVVIG